MGLLGAAITGWLAFVRLTGQQAIGNRPLLLFILYPTGVADHGGPPGAAGGRITNRRTSRFT